MQQTDAVLKSTGGAAKVTAGHVGTLADSISRVSGVDDEVIQAGENMLLTFKNIRDEAGRGNDIFTQSVQVTTDLAAGMAAASGGTINMKSSSIMLGKALNDPIAGMTSLTRVGVQFSEEQQNEIAQLVKHNNLLGAQKVILAEVSSQFAGSAAAQATASGKAAVAFENLAESVGEVLSPAITFLAGQLTDLLGFLQDEVPAAWKAFEEGVMKAWDAVRPFAETIGNVLIPLFQKAWNVIRDRLIPALEKLAPIFVVIGGAVVAFATVMLAQVALVVTAISYIVQAFAEVVQFVRDKLVEPVVNALAKIGDFLGKIAGWIKDRFVGAWEAAKGPVLAVIQSFSTAIQTLIGWIKSAIDWLSQLGEGVSSALAEKGAEAGVFTGVKPPGAATGGFVSQSGLAVIHKGENIIPASSGGDLILQIDGQTFARISREQLLKLKGSRVSLGLS